MPDVQIHDGSGQDGNGMHTEMCTVHVPTADVEQIFSYGDCVDVSGNFMLPTSSAAVTQVHIDLVGIFHISHLWPYNLITELCSAKNARCKYSHFPESHFLRKMFPSRKTFPGEVNFLEWTFPDKTFPAKSLSRKDVSRKKVLWSRRVPLLIMVEWLLCHDDYCCIDCHSGGTLVQQPTVFAVTDRSVVVATNDDDSTARYFEDERVSAMQVSDLAPDIMSRHVPS